MSELNEAEAKFATACLIGEKKNKLHVCSTESLKGSLFLCGAYELQEGREGLESGEVCRLGSLTLYDGGGTFSKWIEGDRRGPCDLIELGSCEMDGGVLDCKILGEDIVGTALSTGCIRIYRIDNQESGTNEYSFTMKTGACLDQEGLFLSLDWETGPNALTSESSSASKIVTSTQQSSLLLYDVESLNLQSNPILHIKGSHDILGEAVPAWIAAFDAHNPSRIFSGGDDCALKAWDLRTSSLIAKNTKSHSAGVTALQFHRHREHIFASGSYDESVRVWDDRVLTKPLATLHVGGGVWRTKWFQNSSSDFLALACMQAGSCVAEYSHGDDNEPPCLRATVVYPDENSLHEKHLAYGIGSMLQWQDYKGEFNALIASCSFYENTVSLWAY